MWTFFHGPDMSLSLVSSYALVTHLVLLVTDLAAYELDTLPSLHFPGRIIFHKVKGQRSLQGRSLIRLPRMHLAGNLGLQPQSWPGSWSWPTTRWSRPTARRSRPNGLAVPAHDLAAPAHGPAVPAHDPAVPAHNPAAHKPATWPGGSGPWLSGPSGPSAALLLALWSLFTVASNFLLAAAPLLCRTS